MHEVQVDPEPYGSQVLLLFQDLPLSLSVQVRSASCLIDAQDILWAR